MNKQLLIVQRENYNDIALGITAETSRESNRICYVTLNKTYNAILQMLKDKGIETKNFFFIDTITPTLMTVKETPRVSFVESLGSGSSLGDLMNEIRSLVIGSQVDTIIFDSLSSLIIYIGEEKTLWWLNDLISFLEKNNISILLFALEGDADNRVIKQIGMRVDKLRTINATKGN